MEFDHVRSYLILASNLKSLSNTWQLCRGVSNDKTLRETSGG